MEENKLQWEKIIFKRFWQRFLIDISYLSYKEVTTVPAGNHAMVNVEVILPVITDLHMVDTTKKH